MATSPDLEENVKQNKTKKYLTISLTSKDKNNLL